MLISCSSDFLDQFIQESFPVNEGHFKYTMENPWYIFRFLRTQTAQSHLTPVTAHYKEFQNVCHFLGLFFLTCTCFDVTLDQNVYCIGSFVVDMGTRLGLQRFL